MKSLYGTQVLHRSAARSLPPFFGAWERSSGVERGGVVPFGDAGEGEDASMTTVAVGSSSNNDSSQRLKRPAEKDLEEGEQRLTKKLNRLHIGQLAGSNYVAIATTPPNGSLHAARPDTITNSDGDAMLLDDTKTRIFIPDLESEIADIEAQEQRDREGKIEFLPDIERKLNRLPKRVLHPQDDLVADETNQLVLYRVPTALSIPAEQDSVRRAIIESRARAREKAALKADPPPATLDDGSLTTTAPWNAVGAASLDDAIPDDKDADADPMDID